MSAAEGVGQKADGVYARAVDGSDMEVLAGALRDLADAVLPLIRAVAGLCEDCDNIRQVVGDLDQRFGRVEEIVDSLPVSRNA